MMNELLCDEVRSLDVDLGSPAGLPLRKERSGSRPKWLKNEKADPSAMLGISSGGSDAANPVQLNKTFCYLFTQKVCLFEMIIRTYLS